MLWALGSRLVAHEVPELPKIYFFPSDYFDPLCGASKI